MQATWKIMENDMKKVGTKAMTELFLRHPEIWHTFSPGESLDFFVVSPRFKAHTGMFIETINKCVSLVGDSTAMRKLLHEVGHSHTKFNLTMEETDLLIPYFLDSLQSALPGHWSRETEVAWVKFIDIIFIMFKEVLELGSLSERLKNRIFPGQQTVLD